MFPKVKCYILCTLGFLYSLSMCAFSQTNSDTKVGTSVAEMSLLDKEDKVIPLTEFQDKTVVLYFWGFG